MTADGVPRLGVTITGELENRILPVPVSSVTADARLADEGVAKNVATPAPSPDTPVLIGNPVALVNTARLGVPIFGVNKTGLVANTKDPEPVSSVMADAKLELEGVAKNVATPAPRPLTPVLIGRLVALIRLADCGVPKTGVTNVGDVANTNAPEPVSSEITPANSAEVVAAN